MSELCHIRTHLILFVIIKTYRHSYHEIDGFWFVYILINKFSIILKGYNDDNWIIDSYRQNPLVTMYLYLGW